MSKARAKGTQYEIYVRDRYLRPNWEGADRAPLRGTADVGDFDGTPYIVEAKKHDSWRLPSWIRTTSRKAVLEGRPWCIVFAGDKRMKGLDEDYVVCTAELFFELAGEAG